jgi:glucan biosynthesis protein C
MEYQQEKGKTQRFDWIDNLRSLNILGTVAFHSSLAYSPYINKNHFEVLTAFPLIQTNQAVAGVDFFLGLRLSYAMQLMFYLSGLFVWRSLQKRGPKEYLILRFRRLIIPFILGYLLIMPITYGAAMVQDHLSQPEALTILAKGFMPGVSGFGQLWFLLLLFVFEIIIAGIYASQRDWVEQKMQKIMPRMLYGLVAMSITLAYLLLVNSADRSGWARVAGNLIIPMPRVGVYGVYFVLGVISGCQVLNAATKSDCLFVPGSSRKPRIPVGLITIALFACSALIRSSVESNRNILNEGWAWLTINSLYPLTGMFIVMSLVLLAKSYLNTNNKMLTSLNHNSYGIYMLHWAYVSWIQLVLTQVNSGAAFNPLITMAIAIPASWLTAAWLIQKPIGKLLLGS